MSLINNHGFQTNTNSVDLCTDTSTLPTYNLTAIQKQNTVIIILKAITIIVAMVYPFDLRQLCICLCVQCCTLNLSDVITAITRLHVKPYFCTYYQSNNIKKYKFGGNWVQLQLLEYKAITTSVCYHPVVLCNVICVMFCLNIMCL